METDESYVYDISKSESESDVESDVEDADVESDVEDADVEDADVESDVEDAGEDAEGTNITEFEGIDVSHMKPYQLKRFMEMRNPVKDKRKYTFANYEPMKTLIAKGLINPELVHYEVWVDKSKAIAPQKEEPATGAFYSLSKHIAPERGPSGPIKIIGDDPTYGRAPPIVSKSAFPEIGAKPPKGYESFQVGERVTFLGDEIYEGFLTRADGRSFYISGFEDPFYYEDIFEGVAIINPAPEFSYVIPVDSTDFAKNLEAIKKSWPELAKIYENQQTAAMEGKIIVPKITGLVLYKGFYSWVYDFTMNPNDLSKELIRVFWGDIEPDYSSITQYVSVFKGKQGFLEGTVIGFVKDKVRVRLDIIGKIVHVSLGNPTLKIIPGKGEGADPVIPTVEKILSSPVTPDIRLVAVNKLFDNFAEIIPGLIKKEGEKTEEVEKSIPSPFITAFRTKKEYMESEFHRWLRAKYIPDIIKELPYGELQQKARQKATMGLGEAADLNEINNRWGLDLVNSLEENCQKRMRERGIKIKTSFYHWDRDLMLAYLQNASNKTVFEIEIQRGLDRYEPYQPPQHTKGFKLEGVKYIKTEIGKEEGVIVDEDIGAKEREPKQFNVIPVGGTYISTEWSKPEDPETSRLKERNKLAVALTNMIRAFMIKFPISEDKIYQELVDKEIESRFNQIIPTEEDINMFNVTYVDNLDKLYNEYTEKWNESLSGPKGDMSGPNEKVKKIIGKQEIIDQYEGQLEDLRRKEIELQEDPNDPGRIIPEFSLPAETRRLLDIIKGDREILKDSIQKINREIQMLGSSPRIGPLTMKGQDVRDEIKQFERNRMEVNSKEDNTVKSYLQKVLYPLIFISKNSSVSDYSKIFRSNIANRSYPIRSLPYPTENPFLYFPEFYMRDNNPNTFTAANNAIKNVSNYLVKKFVQEFINAKYLGPRRTDTRPERIDFGFNWRLATISPQEVCERQTESGKTLARIGYQEQYYKKQNIEKISMGGGLLEKQIVTETETPLYKTIEDGNLIIERNPVNKKFTCHSRPEIILQIAAALKDNPFADVIFDPRTGYPYSSDFIDKMRKRYEKEIEKAVEELPENFVLTPTPKASKTISETIYDKRTGDKITIGEEEEEDIIIKPKQWKDERTFHAYIKPKDKVLVLFCSDTDSCTKFKENEWIELQNEYPNILFLDIDPRDIDYGGSDIAVKYRSAFMKYKQYAMKVPSVFLFVNGEAKARRTGDKDKIKKMIKQYEGKEDADEEPPAIQFKKEGPEPEEVVIESDEDLSYLTDVNSFRRHITAKRVIILFCDNSPKCNKIKPRWKKLVSSNPNVIFLDINVDEGGKMIAGKFNQVVKGQKPVPTKTVPNVTLYSNGKLRVSAPFTEKNMEIIIARAKK